MIIVGFGDGLCSTMGGCDNIDGDFVDGGDRSGVGDDGDEE